jgi:hypothetical protein
MQKRGRKSQASLETVKVVSLSATDALVAPDHLTPAQVAIWNEVIADQPASAFSPTHAPLLEMYCRHVINNRLLGEQMMKFDYSSLKDHEQVKTFDRLLAMAERESRAASSLATRLRITRQAIDQQTVARMTVNGKSKAGKKPWEVNEIENDAN